MRPLPDYWPFESPLDGREEYPVEGGPRFVRPALSVRTEEGRGTEWSFEAYERAEDGELRLRFRDGGLTITLHYRMRGDVLERWVTLANDGADVELLRADSAVWTLPDREGWRLSQLHGRWAAESRLHASPSPTATKLCATAGTRGIRKPIARIKNSRSMGVEYRSSRNDVAGAL